MSIRIAGQVIASAGSLTAHNEDPNAHPDIRELIGQGGGGGGYSKEEIDNKLTVVNTAILGNADAIQKTRSDFMESDSELQQQINAHANELTTQKNDIDDLGDQVAVIESKIPAGTSDTNPLINKQQLLDEEMDIREDMMESDSELQTQINALAEAIQGGGGSVPDNVYTADNLIAGKNVTFTEVPPEGGIDSHTKALWHFDEDKIDVIGSISCPNNIYASQYKFGSGCIRPNKTSTTKTDISSLGLDTTKEVTVDFWFKPYSESKTEVVGLCATPTDGLLLKIGATVSLSGAYWTDGDGTVVVSGLDVANWYHCGFVYDPSSKAVSIFIDGEKKGAYGVTGTPSFTAFALYGSASYPYVDELRISDIIRYTSNFTPETEAYSATASTGPSKTAIDVELPEINIPEGIYTQTNLLGGKDIEIVPEPVDGGINENTVAVWHFDGDTNWIDDRGTAYQTDFSYQNLTLNTNFKFGTGSAKAPSGGARFSCATLETNYGMKRLSMNSSFTLDFWFLFGDNYESSTSISNFGFTGSTNGFYWGLVKDLTKETTFQTNVNGVAYQTNFVPTEKGLVKNTWHHIAMEYYVKEDNTGTSTFFIDGNPVASIDFTVGSSALLDTFQFGGRSGQIFDEVRISNIARYKGQSFTPPTKAYEVATPTGNMVVNFTGKAGGNGKNIGEVYYSQSSLASDNSGALPLFTGESIASANTIYPEFYAWVKKHTELCKTKDQYDAALAQYGECPFYVVDEENGSLRLPKLQHYIKNATAEEGITQKEAGLPNLTGSARPFADQGGATATGPFTISAGSGNGGLENWNTQKVLNFDASLANSIYGNSDTVTPAHTTLFPWVYAYNAAIPVSVAQTAEFQEGLSGKADTDLGNVSENIDYVVESYNDGTNWYRVYKSGWIEQGGYVSGTETYTLLKPMKDTNYIVLVTQRDTTAPVSTEGSPRAGAISSTQIYINGGKGSYGNINYYVCGQADPSVNIGSPDDSGDAGSGDDDYNDW